MAAAGGGVWNGTQNKIRPGVYIDFTSDRGLGSLTGVSA